MSDILSCFLLYLKPENKEDGFPFLCGADFYLLPLGTEVDIIKVDVATSQFLGSREVEGKN